MRERIMAQRVYLLATGLLTLANLILYLCCL